MSHRKSYTYRVVTSNGHGVHSRDFKRCCDAKARAAAIAAVDRHGFGPYEIERVQHLDSGWSRRYFLRRGSRWVHWQVGVGADDRCPDWLWPSAIPDSRSEGTNP
jgi:hypothetical protein